MKTVEQKIISAHTPSRANEPFFVKRNNAFFGGGTISQPASFFASPKSNAQKIQGNPLQTKVPDHLSYSRIRQGNGQVTDKYEQENTLIQRQKQPGTTIEKDISSNPKRAFQ